MDSDGCRSRARPAAEGADGSPYAGRHAVLATKHGKLDHIAPALARVPMHLSAVDVDTDTLGTFTGEIARTGTPHETAVAKARLAMAAAASPLGVASEGSFGPHPDVPWVTVDRELVALVDDTTGLVIYGSCVTTDTVAFAATLAPGQELGDALRGADLSTHAVIVRPADGTPGHISKGLRTLAQVEEAIGRAAAASATGSAQVETDFRAHLSPSRQRAIAAAAQDLATRVLSRCPACASPGWGRVRLLTGLPCAWCGRPTNEVRAQLRGCVRCAHTAEEVLEPGRQGDPARCDTCNP